MRTFNNLKLIIRSLFKNKTVTSLNLLGLTVGLSVSILILIFVINQNSIDRFIPNIDNIYCLTNFENDTYFSQNEINLIKDEVAEFDKLTYCSEDWSAQVFLNNGEHSFQTEKMLTADSCFFRVFAFRPVYGDPTNGLNKSNTVVLTRSFAEKIFGKENPVGKSLIYNSTYLQGENLEVTAVVEDLPSTSSWDFEAVLSFQTNYKIDWYVSNMKHWGTRNYQAFALLNENVSQAKGTAKLKEMSLKKTPDWIKKGHNPGLFPFADVYFDLPQMYLTKHGNRLTVSIIGITGLLILLLACINYINMVTAQREKRNKNIGIIKILGGNRKRIIQLVTTESFVQVLVAGVISILVISFCMPFFNKLTGLNIVVSEVLKAQHFILLLIVLVLMVLLTGLVPGILFSKKIPLLLLQKNSSGKGQNTSRNGLLILQFTVTIALIASIILVKKQNSFLQNQELGFDKTGIIYAHTNEDISERSEAFKNELRSISGVKEFTYSESLFVQNGNNWGRDIINKGEKENIHFSKLSVAPNFFKFFGIGTVEGQDFNEKSNAKQEFIFNATAQKQFRLDNINEARIATSKPENGRITGIIEDYNFESLHVPIRAAGYMCSGSFDEVLYVKLDAITAAERKETLQQIKQVWNTFSPNFPLEYHYLNEKWELNYAKEQQFQKIISYTTLVSILLSCLGLIGLTYFVMEQRIKEIGVRKVNGATIVEILTMLNSDFIKWVVIAFIIACPIAYFAMNKWLGNFAYKTTLSWWIFALAGVLALGIALLTVSWQSWRAATRNPVEALRYE